MNKHHIHVGSKNLDQGYRRFTQASKRAEKGEIAEPETHLNLEDLSMLTPRRLMFTALFAAKCNFVLQVAKRNLLVIIKVVA